LLYVAVQAVETNFITPIFELKAVSLPPALTISVQLLLGSLVGILGLLLASPLCAMAIVLVQALYVNRDDS
jgi:predicted PurR-regulated permease PerM